MFKNLIRNISSRETLKSKDINVMICEDDEITQLLLVKMLKNIGVNSISFFDTAEKMKIHLDNFKKMDEKTILILDIKMPENTLQGDELCKILRNENIKCSIIASTGLKTRSYTTQSYIDDGFDDVLYKPYSKNDLIEVLNNNI